MATFFKKISLDESVNKKKPEYTPGGDVNWHNFYGNVMEIPQKVGTWTMVCIQNNWSEDLEEMAIFLCISLQHQGIETLLMSTVGMDKYIKCSICNLR